MGDLRRHAEISDHVTKALLGIRPDEDYLCLALGNYLTDVSQFRDPLGHLLVRGTVRTQAKGTGPLKGLGLIPVFGPRLVEAILDLGIDLDGWARELLGSRDSANRGQSSLASYFGAVVEGVTQVLFADDVPRAAFWRSLVLPRGRCFEGLPPAELGRIFDAYYTQYFPHEHCDSPPHPPGSDLPRADPRYEPGARGLANYLEEYVDYLAEALAGLEEDWKARRDLSSADPRRHDVLVRLGKVLHGIEDYFFHSNYLELHLWHSLRRGRSPVEPDDEYCAWFAANVGARYLPGDDGEAGDPAAERPRPSEEYQVRTHLRRLRYPSYVAANALDPDTSALALDHLYTAASGQEDLFHTLSIALESLESALRVADGPDSSLPLDGLPLDGLPLDGAEDARGRVGEAPLVLIRCVLDTGFRSRMGRDEGFLRRQLKEHRAQLVSGRYQIGIAALRNAGYLNAHAEAAWRRAIDIDTRLAGFGAWTPGVGGFLIGLLARGQREIDESRNQSRQFDTADEYGPGNAFDIRSDNGASGERIGQHTLMSKDTDQSVPLHEETRRLARFASTAVATILAREVDAAADGVDGLDWEAILRHYLRFPAGKKDMWESLVLEHVRLHGADPGHDEIADQVGRPRTRGGADSRRARRPPGAVRAELERRYVALEEHVD
ncbi:MAG: hypothetical protein ACRCYQ_07455 [Nocardioides sp.]